jgi:hypothetical protein
MDLSEDERLLLQKLSGDEEGLLKTKARPSEVVNRLAQKHVIVNVLTTTLSSPGTSGGTSIWRITDAGRALVESTSNADRSA